MQIDSDAARAALEDIDAVMARTRKAVQARGTDRILVLWGIIWAVCYVATHLWGVYGALQWVSPTWWVAVALGIVGTVLTVRRTQRDAPVRSERERQLGRRVGWSWLVLAFFAGVWLALLWPWKPLQMNAFLVTLIMFAYVILGLWTASRFFIGLGLVVAAAALGGCLLTMHVGFAYYNLWMAVMGGGALIGSGIYIGKAWK